MMGKLGIRVLLLQIHYQLDLKNLLLYNLQNMFLIQVYLILFFNLLQELIHPVFLL